MRSRTADGLLVLAAATACVLALARPARADLLIPREADDVTVVLADGWRLEGVDVRWDPAANVLVVRRGEMGRRLAPADIRAVLSRDGADITGRVLPRAALGDLAPVGPVPASPAATTSPDTLRVEVEVPRPEGRRFVVGLTPVAGYGWLVGDGWWNSVDGGLRAGLRVRGGLTPALYVVAEYVRQDLELADRLPAAPVEPGVEVLAAPERLETLVFGFGLRPDIRGRQAAWPFLELAGGFVRPRGALTAGAAYEKESRPAVQARLGVSLPVVPHLELELSGMALATGRDFADGFPEAWDVLVGGELGVSILLGP